MNVELMDEHLADAKEQQKILRSLHDVSTRMRDRELNNAELAGCGMYFPKTSQAMLANYANRIATAEADNEARRPKKVRARVAPSETTAAAPKEASRRRRARA